METVDQSIRVASEALRQSLSTRNNYTKEDIQFVSTSLLQNSESSITLEIIAKFCIRTYVYSNTGRYSFSFNAMLKRMVQIKSSKGIQMLAVLPDTEAFPELYKNTTLTESEKDVIVKMSRREYLASVNMINMAVSSTDETMTLFVEATGDTHFSLVTPSELMYDKAYKYTLMQELSGVDSPILTVPPKKIKVGGYTDGDDSLQVREVDYLYFIIQLSRESPEIRDIRLKKEIMDFMKRKYSPEIKLCQYWQRNPV